MMVSNIERTINLLCSAHKLDRDKGLSNFEKMLTTMSGASEETLRSCLQIDLMSAILEPDCCWEKKNGCLLALKGLVDYQTVFDKEFGGQVCDLATKLLNDKEPRVRLSAGALLGSLCRKLGPEIYISTRELVIASVEDNIDKIAGDDPSKREMFETVLLMDKLMSGPSLKKRYTSADATPSYDMSGWQHLETSLKNLQYMIEGCGKDFNGCVNEELLLIIFKTLTHSNRNVREAGFYVMSTVLKACHSNDRLPTTVKQFEGKTCEYLAFGLCDSWSQVRLSASTATRYFLLAQDESSRSKFYPLLLPRMCLNRYYSADGVRIYSQETWRQITGSDGKLLVEQYIEPTVKYYCEASKSNNSAVREAACACAAELATKISHARVKTFASSLVIALLDCCQDVCWPVRDAACSACGSMIDNFPEECRPILSSLYPMLHLNLGDSTASVRQSAASALASMVRAFGEPSLHQVCDFIDSGLKGIGAQKADNKLDTANKNECGKRLREMECSMDAYPSTQSTELDRATEPWQSADGCVYLLGELSSIKEAQESVILRLPLLSDAGRHKHYLQHVVLLETICKQLPVIAKNIGKRVFSGVVEEFFDVLFYALESGNGLTCSAASQCLGQLSTLLGQNVVRAKISNYNIKYVAAFESVIFTAPF